MSSVEVRNTASVSDFFNRQGVDHKSAYQRMVCTKNMIVSYREDINATNTVDVNGRLRQLYEDLNFIAKEIIKEEYRLVEQGMKA